MINQQFDAVVSRTQISQEVEILNTTYEGSGNNRIYKMNPFPVTPFKNLNENEKKIRISFIRKVYLIISIRIFLIFGLLGLTFIDKIDDFFVKNTFLFYMSAVIIFVILVILASYKRQTIKCPFDYILLLIWTFFECIILMMSCCLYDWEIVVTSVGLITGVSIGLTVYACFTQINFTSLGTILFSILFIGIFYVGFASYLSRWVDCAYCVVGVFIYSSFLVYDIQLVIGRFRERYDTYDYVFASVDIYADFIRIFINLFLFLSCC